MTPDQLAAALQNCLRQLVPDRRVPADASRAHALPSSAGCVVTATPRTQPGDYTSRAALLLGTGVDPLVVAAALARGICEVPGVAAAQVAGPGFLNITLDPGALAGPARDLVRSAPRAALASAVATVPPGWVALADQVGPEVARLTWARVGGPDPGSVDQDRLLTRTDANPAFRVLYAHARAASVLRYAADLGIAWRSMGMRPEHLTGEPERRVLVAVALAGAGADRLDDDAGRRRTWRGLAGVSADYLELDRLRAVLPLGGTPAVPEQVARLWLTAAVARALAGDLARLGVLAPQRI